MHVASTLPHASPVPAVLPCRLLARVLLPAGGGLRAPRRGRLGQGGHRGGGGWSRRRRDTRFARQACWSGAAPGTWCQRVVSGRRLKARGGGRTARTRRRQLRPPPSPSGSSTGIRRLRPRPCGRSSASARPESSSSSLAVPPSSSPPALPCLCAPYRAPYAPVVRLCCPCAALSQCVRVRAPTSVHC
jgi:hypothetical protein